MKKSTTLVLMMLTAPTFGQIMYKCPVSTLGAPPFYQQAPCTPTGGGEQVEVKRIKATGTNTRSSEQGKIYRRGNAEHWAEQREARIRAAEHRAALKAERAKASTAEAQAQRETTHVIRETNK
ncbi:MAG: hypothetical protein H6974_01320 [Gammaproteobacteria bacterium]|nr:hypothetical protein [Gammaproteobacteria bacterium]MCP5195425.1 hypothetical protein [Gammaproteobacteria bacterium]